MEFYRLESLHYINRKHNGVTDGIITLRISIIKQVLNSVRSSHFYDVILATEYQWHHLIKHFMQIENFNQKLLLWLT